MAGAHPTEPSEISDMLAWLLHQSFGRVELRWFKEE